MFAIIESVIELWLEVYRLLQNYGYRNTVCYGIMRASIEYVMKLWVQVYDAVTELLLYILKCYRITGASLKWFSRIMVESMRCARLTGLSI
jgi:hypothetical protein